jgi:hypothetical protein
MGLGDKFKNLASQAKEAVAEHKEQIHDAVDVASAAADRKTKGKYTAKIAKMNEEAGAAVDKVSDAPAAQANPETGGPAAEADAGQEPSAASGS